MARKDPNDEMNRLARASRDHLRRAEELGRSLDNRLRKKMAAAEDWVPDEDWRRDFAAVTTVIHHSGNSLIRAVEGSKKNLGDLTTDQLEAQLNDELAASAQTLTQEQWDRMSQARAKTK